MLGERQQRSRAQPLRGNPLTSAARPTVSAVPRQPRFGLSAEEQHLLQGSHITQADVARSEHGQERKRRRRSDLVISTPADRYAASAPYTNNQRRRNGIMPRQKASEENYLQMTAMVNSTRAQNMATFQAEQTPLTYGSKVLGPGHAYRTGFDQMGRAPMVSGGMAGKHSPTPSDFLDYDALDSENGPSVPDNDEATEDEMIYSDFSTIDPDKPVPEDNDVFDSFQGNDAEPLPPNDYDESARGIFWQNAGYDVSALR